MGNWGRRRQGGQVRDQEAFMARSDYRGPSQESRKSTVPLWEKKFCSAAGSFSWNKFLENKKYVYMYTNILEWDDSAGKEAFDNAKTRFRSIVNNFPCNISLPDPESHIDDVDWDAAVDPELYSDLEKQPVPIMPLEKDDNAPGERPVFLTEALLAGPAVSCTGWGDAEPRAELGAFSSNYGWGEDRDEQWPGVNVQPMRNFSGGAFSSNNGWGENMAFGGDYGGGAFSSNNGWGERKAFRGDSGGGVFSSNSGLGEHKAFGGDYGGGGFSSNNGWGENKAFVSGPGRGAFSSHYGWRENNAFRGDSGGGAFSSNNGWGETEAFGGGSGWDHSGRNYGGRGAFSSNYGSRNKGSGSYGYRGRRKNVQGAGEK